MIAAWLYIIVANLTSVDSTGAGEILCYPEWWFRDVQMCRVGCSTISRLNKLSFSDFIIFSSSNLHSSHTRLTAIFPVLLRGWAGTRKVKTNLDFTEVRDSEWQWHQLGHMHVCTPLQTDNHTSTPPLSFLQTGCLPAAQPTASKHWRRRHTRTHYTRATTFSFFCLISLLLWSYSALGRVARRKPMWVTKMGCHIPAVCCPGDRIKVLYGHHTRNGKTTDTRLGI